MLSDFGKRICNLGKLSKIIMDVQQAYQQAPENVIDLSSGDPTVFTPLADFWNSFAKKLVMEKNIGTKLAKYGEVFGDSDLLEEIIKLFKSYNINLTKKNIFLTTGGISSLFYIINTYAGISNKKQLNILFPQCPEYSAYGTKGLDESQFISIKPKIKIQENHLFRYQINLDELTFDNVGLIILTRPCNPSGVIISDNELQFLIEQAEKNSVPVVIDGVYSYPFPRLIYKNNVNLLFNKNVINLLSFSKAGLAGGRLGITIGDEELLKPLRFFQINACISIDSFPQMLAALALKSGQFQSILENDLKTYYQHKLQFIQNLFHEYMHSKVPYYLHVPEGGIFQWVWFQDLPITDNELYEKLKSQNVFITPGNLFFFALKDKEWRHRNECIRISLNESEDRMTTGIQKLAEVVNKLYQ